MVEPQLIEDVFVCCTRFLRFASRPDIGHLIGHHHASHAASAAIPQNAGPDHSMLVAVKLANGEEPKEARLPKSLSRAPPGIF